VFSPAWVLAAGLTLQAPVAPAATAPGSERPIHDLATNLIRDLKRVPTRDTALIAALAASSALIVHQGDDDLSNWAGEQGRSGYTRAGSVLGGSEVQGGAALAVYGIGLWAKQPTAIHIGSDLIRAQLLNAVMTRGLKLAAGRRRPMGGGESFPSGHTSAAFTSASVLHAHYGWEVGAPAYAVASFIGWTRIRDRRHWLTDVVIGAAIGTVAGRTVTPGHRRSWTVVPVASTTTAGIFVVR
jgi:membrane-associated phospholipid phosphatase